MVLTRVGLTGASGMLGRHLIELLLERRINIAASSRRRPENLPKSSLWTEWDLAQWKNPEEINYIFPDVDALIHIGAVLSMDSSRKDIFDINVRACLCLSEWALIKRIPMIYISGATVYADPQRNDIRESDTTVISGLGGFYGYSKYLGEQILLHLAQNGLNLCIIRPSSIYGYGMPDNKMISKFLSIASTGGVIELESPVEDRIDLIHARDVAVAILKVLEYEAWGIFNVASESPMTIYEIAQTCIEVVGKGSVECIPGKGNEIPILRFGLNCDAARNIFAFCPELDLKQGIARMWKDVNRRKSI